MTLSADLLARELENLRRRLEALERSAQMSRTSVEGGALVVNDESGTPVLTVGRQLDGAYAVAGSAGGQVIANTLDLPDGSITETDIADDSISTPKLRANAITADKITADALDARTIRGNTIIGATIAGSTVTAGAEGEVVLDDGGLVITSTTDPQQYIALTYTDPEMGVGITLGPGAEQSGEYPGAFANSATIHASQQGDFSSDPDGRFAPTLRIAAPSISEFPDPPTGVSTSLLIMQSADEEGSDPRIRLVTNLVEVFGRLTVADTVSVGGRDMGRGLVRRVGSTSDSAAITTAEQVVLTLPTTLFSAGRVFEVRLRADTTCSANTATNPVVLYRIRKSGTTGAQVIQLGRTPVLASNTPVPATMARAFRTNAAVETALVLTAVTTTGTTVVQSATAALPRYVEVWDIGAAADFTELPVLT